MVIDTKYIAGGFVGLILLYIALSYNLNASIEEKYETLQSKREILTKLSSLESKWSKKAQKEELEKVYKLLDVFDVKVTKSMKRKRKVLTMQVKEHNANKIMAMILNRNIEIKKLKITKIDKHTVKIVVEVL
ncbi:hypothetical protein JHD48_06555 [Sulfurimonas sp. SAG-AH-194-I05]|nr:hypothetical protein [Sulfurimonas sp. SAG-AH-194-I05]MDF1875389.1 hypothetical protein [Sulfurimonas sp. SAG-AH-194-I05]